MSFDWTFTAVEHGTDTPVEGLEPLSPGSRMQDLEFVYCGEFAGPLADMVNAGEQIDDEHWLLGRALIQESADRIGAIARSDFTPDDQIVANTFASSRPEHHQAIVDGLVAEAIELQAFLRAAAAAGADVRLEIWV